MLSQDARRPIRVVDRCLCVRTAVETAVHLPTAVVSEFVHEFYQDSEAGTVVFDIVEQCVPSNEGVVSVSTFNGSWGFGDEIKARIEAPNGWRFELSPHPDLGTMSFFVSASWARRGGFAGAVPIEVSFEGLSGEAPSLISGSGSLPSPSSGGAFIGYFAEFESTTPTTFTAIEFSYKSTTFRSGLYPLNAFRMQSEIVLPANSSDAVMLRVTAVPEPSAIALFANSLGAALAMSRMRRHPGDRERFHLSCCCEYQNSSTRDKPQ